MRRFRFYICPVFLAILAPWANAQRVIHVAENASGASDGSSWADAYQDLQDALDDARINGGCPCEVWVAEGVYKPDRGSGDRHMSFVLQNQVALYGGFSGIEECPDDRDPAAHRSILSGDLADNDDPTYVPTSNCCFGRPDEYGCDDPACTAAVHATDRDCIRDGWEYYCSGLAEVICCDLCTTPRCDNSFNVLRAENVDASAVLDGFEVRAGDANGYPGEPSDGGGIFILDASPVINRCRFVDNAALGGAALFAGSHTPPLIQGCVFEYNRGYLGGAAVWTDTVTTGVIIKDCVFHANLGVGLSTDTNAPIENVVFTDNQQMGLGLGGITSIKTVKDCLFRGNGQGMVAWAAYVLRCSFLGNNTIYSGGAIFAEALLLKDSLVVGNHASAYGHRAIDGFGTMSIVNSTIAGNSPGGVRGSSVNIVNTILWGNTIDGVANQYAQFRYDDYYGTLTIHHSIVEGWTGALGGVGNSGLDPLFVDADGADDILGTVDDDLRLSPDSPAINAGDPNYVPFPGETDLDGHARILCGRIDIGAYEFGIGDYDCNRTVDLTDFANWQTCMTGPTYPVASAPRSDFPGSDSQSEIGNRESTIACQAFDFNADQSIDLLDFAAFQPLVANQ